MKQVQLEIDFFVQPTMAMYGRGFADHEVRADWDALFGTDDFYTRIYARSLKKNK